MGWTADVHVLPGGTDEKKIAAVPYVDTSYTDRINSFGNGSISFPSDYPRLDEILDPVTDVGSLIWFKRDGVATDMAFFAQRWSEDVADDNSRLVKITGPGIGDALLGSIIEPYGTGEALDWIWGGKNILSNPGFEDSRDIQERMELWNDASSGTFTLTVDAATTSALDFDATPNEVEVALELLGTITDCLVSGAGTESEPWQIQYVDPPYPIATMAVTDSLTGGSSTLARTTIGSVDPTPWTKVQRVDRGVPPLIATYASDGWRPVESSPAPLDGTYSWRVNGLAAYAGHQQLVRVTPGMTYQVKVPIWTTDGADRFRWVLRTRLEELIASSTWPDDTVSATSTWDETTWVATDVVIPDGVTEAIFRFAYVGSGNPDPYYTDYNEMNEGLGATSAGDIVDLLLTAAQAKGSLDWLEWNFTSSVDSNGTSWSETALSFVAERGKSIGQVLGDLAKFGIEFHVFWNGTAWELGLYEPYDYDTYADGLGTDRSSDDSPSILLGKGVTSGPIQANSPMANVVYAEGANGLWSEAEDTASIAAWDRREGYVADFGIDDQATLDALAQAQLEERSVVSGDKLRLNSQSHQPYDAFDLGDTLQVTLPPRADKTPRRIVGLVTKLPTASNSSPEWEVDLDQASYGPSTAVAEGLRRVLSKFNKQPDAQLFGAGIPLGQVNGPIETSLLVASSEASDEIKQVADFVCDGVDDDIEINAARVQQTTFNGDGRVQLTEGNYACTNYIDMDTIELVGVGRGQTFLTFGNGTYPTEAAVYAPYGVRDLSIYVSTTAASTPVSGAYVAQFGVIDNVGINMYPTDPSGITEAAAQVNSGNITNCYIQCGSGATNAYGIEATSGSYLTPSLVAHNYIDNGSTAAEGIYVVGDYMNIIGNQIKNTVGDGIALDGDSAHVLIVANRIDSASRHGIYVDSISGANLIVGNTIQDSGTDGIHITSNSANDVVGPNQITGSGGSDVNDSGTDTVHVPASVTAGDVSPLTTKGDLWGFDTVDDRLPISGTNGYILTENSAQGLGVEWAANIKEIPFSQEGALSIGSGTRRLYTKTDRTIVGVYAMVTGAPSGSAAIFDVNMDGNTSGDSIFVTTPANRPTIAVSAFTSDVEVPDVTAWDAGSYLLVDIDAANSATDLILMVQYVEA